MQPGAGPVECPRCHHFTRITAWGVCADCLDLERREMAQVRAHVAEHPRISAGELSKTIEIPIERILRWVREGHLEAARPKGTHPCTRCGKAIHEGELCEACRQKVAAQAAVRPVTPSPGPGPVPAKRPPKKTSEKGAWRSSRGPRDWLD